MRRRIAAAAGPVLALAALALPAGASAHPLGNFTVNHYAGIELAGNRAYVHVVLDFAEIPTFQTGGRVRAPGYAAALARELDLRLDGARVALRPVAHRLDTRKGAGGLPTLRFDAVYTAPLAGSRLAFSDRSYASRIGWREITLVARDGARIADSSVPAASPSDELRAYPRELLRSPLDVRSVASRFVPGDAPGAPPRLGRAVAPIHSGGGLEALIEDGELSAGVVFVSLLVAAFWGAAHALTPGHGKALVAGYLVGARGRPRHAFLLGGTVTVAHTAGVFALGLVTLVLSRFVVPEQLYPWLTLVSGVLVVAVGLGVMRGRLEQRRRRAHAHAHAHGHPHSDPHEHADAHDLSPRGLVGVGVAAGLLPCPSALVVLLSAIALHRLAFGLALIVAFSIGLAATITGIGLVAVLARRAFARARFDGPLVRALPALSAAVIVVAGVAIMARALPRVF